MRSSSGFGKGSAAQPSGVDAPTRYSGFSEAGNLYFSELPIDSACTRAHAWLVSEARGKSLSPAEVAEVIAPQPRWVQNMFKAALAEWPKLTEFWQWPCAFASSSAEQCLKDAVCRAAREDENAWARLCETAEKRSGSACRFDAVGERILFLGLRLVPPDFSEACRAHSGPPASGQVESALARQENIF